jgi:hypothetical protein
MPRFRPHGFIRQLIQLYTVNDGPVLVESHDNPLAAVTNRYVTTTNMKVGAYTVANGGLPGDGLAHLVTATVSKVVENDTMGTLVVVGIDNDGVAITDTLTLNNGDTASGLTTGVKAMKRVDTVTGAGWVDGGTPDTIVVGFSAVTGLDKAAAADADILTVYDKTSLAATASFTGKGNGTLSGTYFTPTGANGTLDYTIVYRPVHSTVLTGTGALVVQTTSALGYDAEVEEFGFVADAALVGGSAAQSFTLKDAAGNVIATLPLVAAAAGSTTKVSGVSIVSSYAHLTDAGTLTVSRVTGGTGFTSGSGHFYVRLRQRTQAEA